MIYTTYFAKLSKLPNNIVPIVKYEDGTVHKVNNGELVDLSETLPVVKIVCNSFGDTI